MGGDRNGVNGGIIDVTLTARETGKQKTRWQAQIDSHLSLCVILPLFRLMAPHHHHHHHHHHYYPTIPPPLSFPASLSVTSPQWHSPCQSDRNMTLWFIIPGWTVVASLSGNMHPYEMSSKSRCSHHGFFTCCVSFLQYSFRIVRDWALCNLGIEACNAWREGWWKEIAWGCEGKNQDHGKGEWK